MQTSGLIFPSCSHFVSLDLSGENAAALTEFSQRHGCRVYRCKTASAVHGAIDYMSRCLGLILFAKGLEAGEEEKLKRSAQDLGIPVFQVEEGAADLATRLDGMVAGLVSVELEKIVVFCANQTFPKFFAGLSELKRSVTTRADFDRQVTYCTVVGDILGFCNLKLNVSKAMAQWKDRPESNLIGDVLEATNQFLGLISQNLAQVNVTPKIGLPTVFDLRKIPEVQTLIFFPSVHVYDDGGILGVSLGYTHLDGGKIFDLKGIEPKAAADEVEML